MCCPGKVAALSQDQARLRIGRGNVEESWGEGELGHGCAIPYRSWTR